MNEVQRQARFMAWLVADGPLPAVEGMQALRAHGFDTRNQQRLDQAKRLADIESRKIGYRPSAWVWTHHRDQRPPELPDTWLECTGCGHLAWLPHSQTGRSCYHTNLCAGCYQPAQRHTAEVTAQSPGQPYTVRQTTWRSSSWRGSPLRTRSSFRGHG